jgi:hypothetical protein
MGRDRPQSAGWRRSPGRSLSVRRSSTSSRQSGAGKSWFLRAGLIARLSATRRISLLCRSCARSRRMDGVVLDLLCPCGYEIDEGQKTRCDAGGECVHGRREYAMDAQAGSRLRQLLRNISQRMIQEVPPELDACEMSCRRIDCSQYEWIVCENRIARANCLEAASGHARAPTAAPALPMSVDCCRPGAIPECATAV